MRKSELKVFVFCALALLLGSAQTTMGAVVPNDNCSNATPVGNVTNLAFDTCNATFDGPGHYMNGPNFWYVYTATCSGIVTVSLCGSSYDTKLAVYNGSSCNPSAGALIIGNDDGCGSSPASQVTFGAVSGSQYLIEVGGYLQQTGLGVMTITCETSTCPTPNDNCANAQPVGEVWQLGFDNRCATADGPHSSSTNANIWYLYTPSCTGKATISLCGSEFDTILVVYDWAGCPPSRHDIIDSNDDFCDYQSQVTIDVTAGSQYLIEVGGYTDAVGQGKLTITCQGTTPPPQQQADECSNAKAVGDVTNLAFDTCNATFDGPGLCMTSPNFWYCYTASCTGKATVSLCGSSYDTKLAVYNGCQCNPTSSRLIGCNDDFCGQQSQLIFDVTIGNQYLIEVGGYQNVAGQGLLSISCEGTQPPPQQQADECSKAKAVGDVTNLAFNTTQATFDGPGRCMTSPNIWYCYTASCSGKATISLCGSSYDTKLAVYNGCQCNPTSSRLIGCNDDYCGQSSQLIIDVVAGNQYLIEVGGYQSAAGQGLLSISCVGQALAELDFGDAPDSTNNFGIGRPMTAYSLTPGGTVQANFPTVYNDGGTGPYGPFHRRPLEVAYLGDNVSLEVEADIGVDQDGTNNIDPPSNTANKDGADDGVAFPMSLPNCGWANFNYKVKVINPGTDLWVNVWFDWNRDGDWDDDSITNTSLSCSGGLVSEWAVRNQYLYGLQAGINQLATPAFLSWHPQGAAQKIWMRITLSEKPWKGGSSPGKLGNGGSGPQDGYTYGETEDYFFTPTVPQTECSICQDLNGDGQVNYQDLSLLTQQWLARCTTK